MKQRPLYPKTYATVVGLFPGSSGLYVPGWPEWLVIHHDGDPPEKREAIPMSWKNGGRSSTLLRVGKRIKLYQRPGVPHPNFRMVGD
jgi:hypothetical protein